MFDKIKRKLKENLPQRLVWGTAFTGYFLISAGLYLAIGQIWVLFICAGILLLGGMGIRTAASFVWDGLYQAWLAENETSS